MPKGTATTKVINVDWFYLAAQKDFGECLESVAGIGYYGMQQTSKNADGSTKYQLIISSDKQANVEATIGQVLIWDKIKIAVLSLAQAQAMYNITT